MFLLGRRRCVHLDEALETIKKSQLIFPEGSYKLTLNLSFCVNLVTSEVGEVRLKSRIEEKKKKKRENISCGAFQKYLI